MEECECRYWARDNILLMTHHHPRCPKYNVEEEALSIIRELIRGIDYWASDEDGVHPSCWQAYQSAKFFIGDFSNKEIHPPEKSR